MRDGWVAQHLRNQVIGVLDGPFIKQLSADIIALGTLKIDGRDVPVYLVRRLSDERAHAAIDTQLRARNDRGTGLVLQAGKGAGSCLAANVLTPISDHIEANLLEIVLSARSMKAAFRHNRLLAKGGQAVELVSAGPSSGTLLVPGQGTIYISGEHRVRLIRLLVEAHNSGPASMATADLIKGIDGQSLANIFGQPLWDKLKADFLRSPTSGQWEIAA